MKKSFLNINLIIGMVFFIVSVLLSRYTKVEDFVIGLSYGIAISFLIIGSYNNKKIE